MTKEELAAIRAHDAQYEEVLPPVHAPGQHTMDCQCDEIQAVLDRRVLLAHLNSKSEAGACATPHVLPESLRLAAAFVELEPQRNSDAEMMREAASYIEELESRDHCSCEDCQRSRRNALAADAARKNATPNAAEGAPMNRPICDCGHALDEHASIESAPILKACTVEGCGCMDFALDAGATSDVSTTKGAMT